MYVCMYIMTKIKLKCPRKECGHTWNYKGKNIYRAICPICGTSVSLKKNKISNKEELNELLKAKNIINKNEK